MHFIYLQEWTCIYIYIYIYITIFNSKSVKQTDAKYYTPKIIYPTKIENILKCNQSETDGLAIAF